MISVSIEDLLGEFLFNVRRYYGIIIIFVVLLDNVKEIFLEFIDYFD